MPKDQFKAANTYPSLSMTGSSMVVSPSVMFAPTVEITSRKCLIASTCFSVQNRLYSWPVYCSLHGCWADRELTRFPSDWIVFEMSVSVRVVCSSCFGKGENNFQYETRDLKFMEFFYTI